MTKRIKKTVYFFSKEEENIFYKNTSFDNLPPFVIRFAFLDAVVIVVFRICKHLDDQN